MEATLRVPGCPRPQRPLPQHQRHQVLQQGAQEVMIKTLQHAILPPPLPGSPAQGYFVLYPCYHCSSDT